ncbi:hypothetical protein [Enemella sp. A6]|uniref:hypothetical protein n=1 Tax=Enemella sp. A6 TaxID=3440152 RepID=UPI003EB77358
MTQPPQGPGFPPAQQPGDHWLGGAPNAQTPYPEPPYAQVPAPSVPGGPASYGQVPGGQVAPVGHIDFVVQGNVFAPSMIPPVVTIDGRRISGARLGSPVTVPVPPGRHRIEAHTRLLRRYGQAALDVDVRPGELVRVYYAPPLHQFTDGNMGLVEQEPKGIVFFSVMIGFALSLMGIAIALMVFAATL